ncbi:hypothetical protein FOL47_011359 [Perkinsus chesapeaki]|uniref:Uncharacterized protein n=1 Tax=Perkinsus chesapeaki TaxID=330153 RepID=A0A7J6MP86_PERCH|nr:hypothetical protein FOL47_011359 [Perkinsus chesapeaki]
MGCSDGDNIALPEDISMDCLDGHTGGQNSRSPQDNVAMGIIMLNSSLLKGLHVLDCLQSRCVQEYPELNYDLEDHLMSFDGSLTTIYEGHQSQKVVEDVEDLCERLVIPDGNEFGGILNGNLITTEDANAALTSQKDKYELDKVEMAEKQRQLEEQCEQLRLALEASQKSRPVTAETCTGSNPDAANSSGEILVYDSDEEEGNKSKGGRMGDATASPPDGTIGVYKVGVMHVMAADRTEMRKGDLGAQLRKVDIYSSSAFEDSVGGGKSQRTEGMPLRRDGQSTGSVGSRCTGRFTIEDGESISFDRLPGGGVGLEDYSTPIGFGLSSGSVSIRRKETLDELDIEPVLENSSLWRSTASCCEIAGETDGQGSGEESRRESCSNGFGDTRSCCAELPRPQLSVKVPKRIGRFDVVEATPTARPVRMPSMLHIDSWDSNPSGGESTLQLLDDLNRQVRALLDRNAALEAENSLLHSRCERFSKQLRELGAQPETPADFPVALTRADTPPAYFAMRHHPFKNENTNGMGLP